MIPRLKELYLKEIQTSLKDKFGLKNLFMGPKIEKVVLNMGLGLDGNDSKILKSCEEDLAKITGQKPIITKFKKSVANFKTRKGSNAGLKVTLRKDKMYEFIDRLVNIALPRIKDFRGLSPKGFDAFGNYTFGIKEHIIFPEVSFDRADKVRGLSPKGIDNSYNYSFGIKEHIVFPEVNFDKVDKIRGLDITIVTSSKSKKGTLELLKEFNFPLSEKKN